MVTGVILKISIVTISYNQVRFLRECIESVLSQKDGDVEYIVVDPGSTDRSRELIESYADKIDKIVFEPDQGPADGLNKGFSRATGEIFGYINADDYLLPGSLRYILHVFQKWPEVDVIFGDGLRVDGNGNIIRKMLSCPWNLKAFLYGGCPVVQQTTYFKKTAFEIAGGFNVINKTCWDGELLVDMALTDAHFKSYRQATGVFRVYEGSISGSGRLVEKYKKDRERLNIKVLGKKNNSLITLVNRGYYRAWKLAQRPAILTSKISWRYN